ncbi:MAG: hypothetical protein M1829_006142 [Trizodia sp. TS-e1964]|nr:MAG: hypothetical protein M1829_006142 [Trizodia sp. TS-e1964]
MVDLIANSVAAIIGTFLELRAEEGLAGGAPSVVKLSVPEPRVVEHSPLEQHAFRLEELEAGTRAANLKAALDNREAARHNREAASQSVEAARRCAAPDGAPSPSAAPVPSLSAVQQFLHASPGTTPRKSSAPASLPPRASGVASLTPRHASASAIFDADEGLKERVAAR